RIEAGDIQLLARDTPTPSPLSHEILNSNPYTYLDDAPLEERRARAVSLRRTLSDEDLKAFGALDEEVIAKVESEVWPDLRSADELADALRDLGAMPETSLSHAWTAWMAELLRAGRALRQGRHYYALERKELAEGALAGDEAAVTTILRVWLMAGGPATAAEWARKTGLEAGLVERGLLCLESGGGVLRGRFTPSALEGGAEEWCDREVMARIHRRCLSQLRQEMAPVSSAEFMRFLLRWQHVSPSCRLHGAPGLAEVIGQLQGLQLPVAAWEKEILPARVADYQPTLLDELCLNGTVVWGRLLPGRVEEEEGVKLAARRRVAPNRNTSLSLMLRQDLPWLLDLTKSKTDWPEGLGPSARQIVDLLDQRGAMFFNELHDVTRRLRSDLDQALWELVTAGAVTCDGFAGLRNLIDPSRRREKARLLARYGGARGPMFLGGGGRWSLLRPARSGASGAKGSLGEPAELEALAEQYLRRWGIVFRDLLFRESFAPPWRVLAGIYRRLEARGEIRGGRFVDGFAGEQFALPEALNALRNIRKQPKTGELSVINCADPLNLT
ncbi:MAG TPA: DEAD/DEAH box helicase, partial [bacterium]|nr:DEAD/DEAH box helicase [bacterium]